MPSPRAEGIEGTSRRDRAEPVDAVLPADDGWRLFQWSARRHAVVPATAEAWPGGLPEGATWRALSAPSGAFRPVQAVPGQRGYFYLVDAASARLCLYDGGAALLSTFPLPAEFTPFPAGRAAVFRGADGAFTFVDYGSGEAWQFAERQTGEAGATRWIPRGRVKLPSGARECAQPAGSADLFCRDAAGAPLRFDGTLNRVAARAPGGDGAIPDSATATPGGRAAASFAPPLSARWAADGEGWVFEAAAPGEGAPPSPLFRYRPAARGWERAADTTRAPARAR